jgi:hypothetical protein
VQRERALLSILVWWPWGHLQHHCRRFFWTLWSSEEAEEVRRAAHSHVVKSSNHEWLRLPSNRWQSLLLLLHMQLDMAAAAVF